MTLDTSGALTILAPQAPAPDGRPVFFLATPLHDGRVHEAYMDGVVRMSHAAPGQLIISKLDSPMLALGRDVLTAHFLRSNATHLLCVDSDIGWGPADVEKLLAANKDFVSGLYARKRADRMLASSLTDRREGALVEVEVAAAGFLLLTRSCVERMVLSYPELRYDTTHGEAWGLWSPIFKDRPYGEDASFCIRWGLLGGKIWAHPGVVLKHYGDYEYLPQER